MKNLIQKALTASKETQNIEFKEGFDSNSNREWCEIIKDIVAISNSGGGIILFGLDNAGVPRSHAYDMIARIDPAIIGDKISKYTNSTELNVEIIQLEKFGSKLIAFLIPGVIVPLVFQKPGTYDIGGGKQNNAFGVGTVYFRHGAKSAPGTSEDLRKCIDRQTDRVRKSWMKGVKKVVKAPIGSQLVMLPDRSKSKTLVSNVKIVNDPKAFPVQLTHDPLKKSGIFIQEELSEGIFDEINNVVDANRVLVKGKNEFVLGPQIYYRIYAERQHVIQSEETLNLLMNFGFVEIYAPALFWCESIPDSSLIQFIINLYLYPIYRHVHSFIRITALLGSEFAEWLLSKWSEKWQHQTQPPQYYFSLKKMVEELKHSDPILVGSRLSLTSRIIVKDESPILVDEILKNKELGSFLLSKSCIHVFQGNSDHRSIARDLDYLIYGSELNKRRLKIVKGIIKGVGDRKPNDIFDGNNE